MEPHADRDDALTRAIEQAGGTAELTRHINSIRGAKKLTTHAISQWLRCPADRVWQVVSHPNVTETPFSLRPDTFGVAPGLLGRFFQSRRNRSSAVTRNALK